MNDYQQLNLPLGVPSKPSSKGSKRSTYNFIPDPYWKDLTESQNKPEEIQETAGIAPQQVEDDRWNPADFGEVPRKLEPSGQITIFYDSAAEPPDPDDYQTLEDYHRAWAKWETSGNSSQDKHGSVTLDLERATPHASGLAVNEAPTAPQHKDPVEEQSPNIECDNFESGNFIGVTNATSAPQHINTVGEQVSLNTKQITAKPLVGEQVPLNTKQATEKLLVGEQVTQTTKKSAPQHEVSHWVEKYWVERAGNKYWYWRYMWMSARKINRVYIGSARSPLAQQKKQAVEDAIADGQSPLQIKYLLKGDL